ncbi:uncharacterized protein LOC128957401 [Oppia nitens]|uniref:uncharacterized protein LOC128957401 n=1 Tax=Oppia nitens TaxID=1686743 RepID=UPI0023DB7EDD|nr:uncharacterized protein LOC128957401 [Oppia nitens]
MDSHFEVPTIPKVFVPQPIYAKPESKVPSNASKHKNPVNEVNNIEIDSTTNDKEDDQLAQEVNDGSALAVTTITPTLAAPPKLCDSCSQILLQYFVPLQQYIDQVVQLARGEIDKQSAPLPLPLFNTRDNTSLQVFNQQTYHRNEQNVISNENSSENRYDTRVSRSGGNESHGTDNRNYNQNNQNHNYYHNTNQYQNQRQSCDSNYQTNHESYERNESHQQIGHNYSGGDHRRLSHESQSSYRSVQQSHHDNQSTDNQQLYGERSESDDNNESLIFDENQQSISNDFNKSTQNSVPIQQSEGSNENNRISTQESSQQSSPVNAINPTDHQYEEPEGMTSPYAFVTIAYNNLSATNAVILANSLFLTNNKTMNIKDEKGNRHLINIPFIIIIGGNINPILKEAIYMVFDEVITQPLDVRVALLSDESIGIQQYKLQLWKELKNYRKCLYLESSTLVIGKVTNLFDECEELSACVDYLFPDNFNCSVFVFEPSLITYEQIISFALFHQKCQSQKDEGVAETLDEMTLLNQFFAPKWKKISFIYNFVKNDYSYTQIPAFMKFGDSIKIVNFGHMVTQTGISSHHLGTSSVQPWHIVFDLLVNNQQESVKSMSIDNYSKFYLNCFIQRLWPIIQTPLTPLLINRYGVGRREWSIFDLIRLLSQESGFETNDHMFTQTPITFRRIKSPTDKIAKYKDFNRLNEDDYLTEVMPNLQIDDNHEKESQVKESEESDEQQLTRDDKEETVVEEVVEKESNNQLTQPQQDERSKREWEAGRIDWMGEHQSDKIIDRLKRLIN